MITSVEAQEGSSRTLIDALLEEQRDLTAVERFARWHDSTRQDGYQAKSHRGLIPLTTPGPGEQYAFEVDLDRCSGCKSCVTACHSLNGLDEDETWRSVGLLHGRSHSSFQQTITTACHHCVDPGCLNGCPVLAYDKEPLTGIVRHLDDQCIGCQYCVFMCPYEVPKYSEQRGIVRKCDMCHQRLAHGEAPACAQACPSEAIRITIIEKDSVRNGYRIETANQDTAPNLFLPCSPDPAITLPTTRYVSTQPLPPDLVAGDTQETRSQPAHAPLVWMLVLTQLGAGGFAMLPFCARATRPALALLALAATWLGLAGSVLHLGKPLKAWRAFLGLRRSWLSREIVGFGIFAFVAATTTIALNKSLDAPGLVWLTAFAGLCCVYCSGMTYHVTRRECWSGAQSLGRFFATTALLGSAAAVCAAGFARGPSAGFQYLLIGVSALKFLWEIVPLLMNRGEARRQSSRQIRSRFASVLAARFVCGCAGGLLLPALMSLGMPLATTVGVVSLGLCTCGEFMERWLFFRAAVFSRMPGSA